MAYFAFSFELIPCVAPVVFRQVFRLAGAKLKKFTFGIAQVFSKKSQIFINFLRFCSNYPKISLIFTCFLLRFLGCSTNFRHPWDSLGMFWDSLGCQKTYPKPYPD